MHSGVKIGLEWPEIAVRYVSQPKDQCLPGPHLDCLFSILSTWSRVHGTRGGIFRVSKSAWNGLKSLSGTGLNPKPNVCLDPTLTVCFQYYRLGPECMVHGGHLPGVLIGLEWPEIAVRYGSQPKDQCLPGPHLDCLFSILSTWSQVYGTWGASSGCLN